MSARARGGTAGRRRRRGAPGGGAHDGGGMERWLLTYADMITLLMALFMVLFSISSVNISKYKVLQRSLQDAFSGKVVSGGQSILQTGADPKSKEVPDSAAAVPAVVPPRQASRGTGRDADFKRLQARVEAYATAHGLSKQLQATISRRGLVVRLLTDDVLFDSGSATLKPQAQPILAAIGGLLRSTVQNPTVVEGHTDNVPIRGGAYPSNWELSTARATSVLRVLIAHGAKAGRLSAAGYASTRPIAGNGTDAGRHRNRRVEIVVLRRGQNDPGGDA